MDDVIIYNIIYHTSFDDFSNICSVNHTFNKIGHDKFLLIKKFMNLSKITPMENTYDNLIYVINMINFSKEIINYMKKLDNLVIENVYGYYVQNLKLYDKYLYDKFNEDIRDKYHTLNFIRDYNEQFYIILYNSFLRTKYIQIFIKENELVNYLSNMLINDKRLYIKYKGEGYTVKNIKEFNDLMDYYVK
jgi:hypothetical protein